MASLRSFLFTNAFIIAYFATLYAFFRVIGFPSEEAMAMSTIGEMATIIGGVCACHIFGKHK